MIRDSPFHPGTFEATREAVQDVCGRYEAPRVLDIGCGRGELLVALAPRITRGLGIDISEEHIRVARRGSAALEHLDFHVSAVEELERPDLRPPDPVPFDVILFVGSLEHMHDPLQALEAARTRAHPESRIVIVAISPRAPHAVFSRWMLRGTRNQVRAHLGADGLGLVAEQAGLRVEEARPLHRGSRRNAGARLVSRFLATYDRVGGPTRAVVLVDGSENDARGAGRT